MIAFNIIHKIIVNIENITKAIKINNVFIISKVIYNRLL
jgi:hypothetical protein